MESIVPIRRSDRMAVRAFLNRLSPETRRARYLGPVQFDGQSLQREMQRLQGNAAGLHTVLVAREGKEVRGIGEYIVDGPDADCAEVALVVDDAFQDRGLGTSLFLNLERDALRRGIRAFTGEVANDNHRVLRLLKGTGRRVEIQPGYASSHFEMTLCDCTQSLAA